MPLKRKRSRSSINRFTHDLEQDLTYGPYSGLDRDRGALFGPMAVPPPDPMTLRAAWVLHRHRLMGKYVGEGLEDPYDAGQRPWAFWEFEAPEGSDGTARQQTEILRRHGLLSDEEEAILTALHPEHSVRMGYCRCRVCLPATAEAKETAKLGPKPSRDPSVSNAN